MFILFCTICKVVNYHIKYHSSIINLLWFLVNFFPSKLKKIGSRVENKSLLFSMSTEYK